MSEFPESGVWVYHQAQAPKLVKTQADLEYNLERGWTREWQDFNTKSMLKAKIAEMKAETDRLIGVLEGMEEYDNPSPVKPLSAETLPVAAEKKRGRPKRTE